MKTLVRTLLSLLPLGSALLTAPVAPAYAQPERWSIVTPSEVFTVSAALVEIRGDDLVLHSAEGLLNIPLQNVQSIFIRDTSGFWSGAGDGALWGAILGGGMGLVTGGVWALTGSTSGGETAALLSLTPLVIGGSLALLGGVFGGVTNIWNTGETVDLADVSVEEKRIFFRELLERNRLE